MKTKIARTGSGKAKYVDYAENIGFKSGSFIIRLESPKLEADHLKQNVKLKMLTTLTDAGR